MAVGAPRIQSSPSPAATPNADTLTFEVLNRWVSPNFQWSARVERSQVLNNDREEPFEVVKPPFVTPGVRSS